MPKISIVIPLYNKAPFIAKTLDSVLNQTFDDYEVVVVDDGSTDEGINIIKTKYSSSKIRLIEKENGGPSSARNMAISEARGEWILLLDADDLLLPYALERFLEEIERHPEANYIVGSFYNMITPVYISLGAKCKVNKKLHDPFYAEATRILTETSGTAIFKRSILLTEPYDESLRRYEDAEHQYRLMRNNSVYMFSTPVAIINRESAAASKPRKNPNEDFVCHLVFENKSFWEKVSLYLLAKDCQDSYPEQYKYLYSSLEKDLRLKMGYYYLLMVDKWLLFVNHFLKNKKLYNLDELMSLDHAID